MSSLVPDSGEDFPAAAARHLDDAVALLLSAPRRDCLLMLHLDEARGQAISLLEPQPSGPGPHPMERILRDGCRELKPNWILVDARAGLADPAGMLLSGLAHLHVLFGTSSEQSWAGLRLVVERLGGDRVRARFAQADCLLVQAMVPENVAVANQARREFEERAREEFIAGYYAADPETAGEEGNFWYVGDADSSDAPHVPVGLSYSSRLADFRSIELVADYLAESAEYHHLAARIGARFGAI